jgi:site-specific DNA-methyltransferase (adenine-specific)
MSGFIAPNSVVTHEDCMALMARYPDKYFDLAVVDPPYGIGGRFHTHHKEGQSQRHSLSRFEPTQWDNNAPNIEYFNELFRVSINQIIWGGNYMINYLHPTRCFIVWDKMTYIPSMSQIEQAWTSFDKNARLVKINSNQSDRIHPTQKPVTLYDWIFKNYAKEGDKILDTHLGSGSSRISAWKAGLDFTACELDADYFAAQEKRFKEFTAQMRLF